MRCSGTVGLLAGAEQNALRNSYSPTADRVLLRRGQAAIHRGLSRASAGSAYGLQARRELDSTKALIDGHRPVGGLYSSEDQLEQRGLARTVLADEPIRSPLLRRKNTSRKMTFESKLIEMFCSLLGLTHPPGFRSLRWTRVHNLAGQEWSVPGLGVLDSNRLEAIPDR